MNKVGFVSVYRGPVEKSHCAEASRLMEEAKVEPGRLDSKVQ
jgi:hypothetical protein